MNIVPHKGHACSSDQICLNGGVCVPYLSKFLCKCMINFSGTHCQNYITNAGWFNIFLFDTDTFINKFVV